MVNETMRLTKNFTLEEFERSKTAETYGIDNRVPKQYIRNVQALAEQLQTIRDMVEIPIHISSGYRCKEVNRINHGASSSQHMKGEAADIYIDTDPKKNLGWTLWDILKLIVQFIDFDQLIWENRPPSPSRPHGSKWIHVSFVTHRKNRHDVKGFDGKSYYEIG